ncbi:MAG: F0F1 ATP synthase subunit A [Acetobacteraceae bacterium]|nr:F0F1 ATP synthase subunit A [Acetobacteraceae bacterium]
MVGNQLLAASEEAGADVVFTLFGLQVTSAVTTMWAIMALLIAVAGFAAGRLKRVPTSRLQALVEVAVEGGMRLFSNVLGPKRARMYFPLLGTFFVFILLCNYSGLIPGAGHVHGFAQPTSRWGVTAGLAAVTFVSTQYFGIRARGLGYFKHFVQPYIVAPIMLPLSLLEEVVRPFALSLRLFANMLGGEMALMALLAAVPFLMPITTLALEVIFGFIQAFIFTLLSAVYFSTATAEHH